MMWRNFGCDVGRAWDRALVGFRPRSTGIRARGILRMSAHLPEGGRKGRCHGLGLGRARQAVSAVCWDSKRDPCAVTLGVSIASCFRSGAAVLFFPVAVVDAGPGSARPLLY